MLIAYVRVPHRPFGTVFQKGRKLILVGRILNQRPRTMLAGYSRDWKKRRDSGVNTFRGGPTALSRPHNNYWYKSLHSIPLPLAPNHTLHIIAQTLPFPWYRCLLAYHILYIISYTSIGIQTKEENENGASKCHLNYCHTTTGARNRLPLKAW